MQKRPMTGSQSMKNLKNFIEINKNIQLNMSKKKAVQLRKALKEDM